MNSEIKIEIMAPEHCAAIAKLEQLCFSAPWSEQSVRSELNNPLSLWLTALRGDKTVGYIGSQTVMDETDMMNVAVLPEERGHGIGRALVLALAGELRARGSKVLFLEVRESNLPAISLYESLGFEKIGLRRNYYEKPKENAIIYRKDLV